MAEIPGRRAGECQQGSWPGVQQDEAEMVPSFHTPFLTTSQALLAQETAVSLALLPYPAGPSGPRHQPGWDEGLSDHHQVLGVP